MRDRPLEATDFRDAGEAADHAQRAAMQVHDVVVVLSPALSTEGGHLSLDGQEAVCTVLEHCIVKAKEARDAADLASGMFRTSRRNP